MKRADFIRFGITPAHAGKSSHHYSTHRVTPDHPRPRGEKWPPPWLTSRRRGSPPPTRGKAARRCIIRLPNGITPAHAGKSIPLKMHSSTGKDHPRPRGEKLYAARLIVVVGGSPPPTRGKACKNVAYRTQAGITPAHAGKRYGLRSASALARDHPRPRGEKERGGRRPAGAWGSPPPTRGKGAARPARTVENGITPAHAGKSAQAIGVLPSCTDHPRPRGEKNAERRAEYDRRGSPPPMRGKADSGGSTFDENRITPAHAGKRNVKRILTSTI